MKLQFRKDYLQDLEIRNAVNKAWEDFTNEIESVREHTDEVKQELIDYVKLKFDIEKRDYLDPFNERLDALLKDADTPGSIRYELKQILQITDDELEKLVSLLDRAVESEECIINAITVSATNTKRELRGGVEAEYNNMAKIISYVKDIDNEAKNLNERLDEIETNLTNLINQNFENLNKKIDEIKNSIPIYKIEYKEINSDNNIELSFIPEYPVVDKKVSIVDKTDDMEIILSEYSVYKESNLDSILHIESNENLEGLIAKVCYYYLPIKQKTEDEGETE